MEYKVLVINPGSTSTKIAVFQGEKELFQKSLNHSSEEIDKYDDILDQFTMRANFVEEFLKEKSIDIKSLDACVGRGGLLPNVKSGGYLVDDGVVDAYYSRLASPHASNLGALIAKKIADSVGIPAYIYDCVTSDEFEPIAKITGMPDCKRQSMCHVLNQKAVGRKVAQRQGKKYEEMKTIIAHLGGGITIGVHKYGKIVDCIRDDAGPFSPERSGSIPLLDVINMCYTGKYNRREMIKRVRGMGGIKAYLGTTDMREVEEKIANGDTLAKEVYEAEAYQIAKGIGEMAPVLDCDIDCIILTGGMAHSKQMTDKIAKRVARLAPVEIFPGEDEMEALNLGAQRILSGQDKAQIYVLPKEERRPRL